MRMHRRILSAAIVGLAASYSVVGWVRAEADDQPSEPVTAAALADEFGGEKYITRACQDSWMSFAMPVSEIIEVLVQGGESVIKGQPLIRARDDEYRLQVALQRLDADSDLEVQGRQAALDQAKVEFDAQTEIKARSSGSQLDYDRARTTYRVRQVELDVAKLGRQQAQLQLELQQSRLDRFTLKAPFDGVVDEVTADLGEVKKETDQVVRVVDIDPLWIDVPTPTAQTLELSLKPGARAWVLMDLPGEARVYPAKVIEVGAEADPGSGTRRVRVELANPRSWPPGLTAWVRFTEPTGAWAQRIAQDGGGVPPIAGASK